MDLLFLASRISAAGINIDAGRKGFAVIGKEREGRISFEYGIAEAMTAFKEAQASADPQAMILAEWTFLGQELQLCDINDKDTITSLTKAVASFDDAFLALEVVEGLHYDAVEKAIPHEAKYRVGGYPKDAFHIACVSHRTRIQNILRAPGLDQMEKALLKQRFANLSAAQDGYVEKQKMTLSDAG